jgi:hypothetical protein
MYVAYVCIYLLCMHVRMHLCICMYVYMRVCNAYFVRMHLWCVYVGR